ncbi:MAG: hypothetical protein QOH26_707 [Actinomycetota bacterium]|jgi:uncharacterized membrane protein|nr:hypothetical protein [Actinomycetota bacterium]
MSRLFSIKPAITLKGRKFKGIRGWAGKPTHPPLTDIPIGAYVLAAAFDVIAYAAAKRGGPGSLSYDFFVSATHVLIAGAIVSVFTAITGFWDWLKSTPRGTQAWRTANWHMAVMLTVTALVIVDIFWRLNSFQEYTANGPSIALTLLTVIVGGLVAYGSAYGGSLVFDYEFNVEQDKGYAWEKSEEDHQPGTDTNPST